MRVLARAAKTVTAVVGLILLAQTGFAAGTTSAAFLRLGSGARSAALGDAFTARADDASATYWNPAGMSRLPSREAMAEHVLHIQDITIDRLAYVHPLGRSGSSSRKALGLSVTYLSVAGIEARSGNTAQPEGSFGASDLYGALSYAQPLSGALSLGVTGKVIRQKIGAYEAGTYAADLGFLYKRGRLQAGAALTNVGPAVKFIDGSYPLPQSLRAGVAVDAAQLPLRLSADIEKLKDESTPSYKMGAEYDAGKVLVLRGGYLTRSASSQKALKGGALGAGGGMGDFTGMAGGLGLRLSGYSFDYAFTPFGELGNAHRMSLSVRF